jgi:hypothetical protein
VNLQAGRPVVLAAPFSTERAAPFAWATTTRQLAAEATMAWLHLPPHELVRRLTRRAAARDQSKIRDLPAGGARGALRGGRQRCVLGGCAVGR